MRWFLHTVASRYFIKLKRKFAVTKRAELVESTKVPHEEKIDQRVKREASREK